MVLICGTAPVTRWLHNREFSLEHFLPGMLRYVAGCWNHTYRADKKKHAHDENLSSLPISTSQHGTFRVKSEKKGEEEQSVPLLVFRVLFANVIQVLAALPTDDLSPIGQNRCWFP